MAEMFGLEGGCCERTGECSRRWGDDDGEGVVHRKVLCVFAPGMCWVVVSRRGWWQVELSREAGYVIRPERKGLVDRLYERYRVLLRRNFTYNHAEYRGPQGIRKS